MKNTILLFVLATIFGMAQAQNTLITKPGASCGIDADILKNDVASLGWQTTNYGNHTELWAAAWTFYANGGGPGYYRSLIDFADLDQVPTGATVVSATLRLYGIPATSAWFGTVGNNYYTGSPYANTNPCWVERITSTWGENTVTWNTQPTVTTTNRVAIPASTSQWNYSVALNVTSMVQDMVNATPANRFGFRIMLQTETYYRTMGFASSDHGTASLWPELEVVYNYSCAQPLVAPVTIDMPEPDTDNAMVLDMNNTMELYPNPSDGLITLSFHNSQKSEAFISVTNTLGQVMKNVSYIAEQGNNRYVLDLSGLSAGNYSVNIQWADKSLPALNKTVVIK